jgi:hypothetical protein
MWHVALEVVADICFVAVALAYWVPAVQSALGASLLALYALGLAGLVFQIVRSVRKDVIADDELSIGGRVFVSAGSVVLLLIVTGPALVWGFLVAVLGRASA